MNKAACRNRTKGRLFSLPARAELTGRHRYYAAGFLTYEAGAAFGLAVRERAGTLPLAWFALFDAANVHEAAAPVASAPFAVGQVPVDAIERGLERWPVERRAERRRR